MVNEKNTVTFHESEEFKSFELLQEKIVLYENYGSEIRDPLELLKEQ